MKLKFDPGLPYQIHAVDAVADLFEGQPIGQTNFEISDTLPDGMTLTTHGVGNKLILTDEQLLANTRAIQERNDIAKVEALQGRDFSIEMETGTGKTYVYLRTIFELNKRFGFKKFIIVVPSVAIREGVLKSIAIMDDHFSALYDNVPFGYFVYDSKRLGAVRQFADNNHVQIMIINIQAFQRDVPDKDLDTVDDEVLQQSNVIYRDNDRMGGRPIEFVQSTNPIVIIDEPQSVDTTARSRRAINQLKAGATLRYSATHRDPYNLLYRLGPIEAYDLKLVKQIEVASIRADDDFSDAFVKLLKTDNTKGIRAQLEIHRAAGSGPKPTKVWVKQGDDLYKLSRGHFTYRQGFVVQSIDATPGYETIEFNQGLFLETGQEIGGTEQEVMQVMVRETVEQHLLKERKLKSLGIKVLSLFFVDKVANYRIYNQDGTTSLGKIGAWFEEVYKELAAEPRFKGVIPFDVEQLHNGYFSQDSKGQARDTRGDTQADEHTYSLIMRDKERLLDPSEPLRFIFSHTALREGWDNPNVFQICTLREVGSELARRQQIGRGLRLPVNQDGERVHDEHLNRLTVIASERYESFAAALQTEYVQEFGIRFGRIEPQAFSKLARTTAGEEQKPVGQETSARIWTDLHAHGYFDANGDIQGKFDPDNVLFKLEIDEEFEDLRVAIVDEMRKYVFKNRFPDARQKRDLSLNKQVHLREDFRKLWERISQKTRYRVHFDTDELIDKAAQRLKAMKNIEPLTLRSTRVGVDFTHAGVSADRILAENTREMEGPSVLPDIITFLQNETELTRHTLIAILREAGRISEFRKNPQQFMAQVAREINYAMHDLMVGGVQYEKIPDEFWQMQRIEEDAEKGITRYINNLYEVQNKEKSLFDAIEFESETEKRFATDLDNNEHVKLFVKLPNWFKIETPMGPYNPDWAFITEREEKLYFVRETKSTLDSEKRRNEENQKVECGRLHFDVIDVNYDVVTSLSEVGF